MTPEQRKAWLEDRKTYIGGSQLADLTLAQLGLKPKQTPYQIWAEKVGEADPEDLSENQNVEWGNIQESVIADWYASKTHRNLAKIEEPIRHPQYDFLAANIDRRICDMPGGLECKNVDKFDAIGKKGEEKWSKGGDDKVPPRHFIQCMAYLSITHLEFWDLAALIGGNDPRIYTITPDQQVIQQITAIGVAFWRLVEKRIPPPAFDAQDALRKYPQHLIGGIVEADAHIAELVEQYREYKQQEKFLEDRIDELKGKLGDFMGPNELLLCNGDELMTWKTQTRKEHFVKASTSRVFRLKAAAD